MVRKSKINNHTIIRVVDSKYRVVAPATSTFESVRDRISDTFDVYRQRILLEKEEMQFGRMVYDLTIIGEICIPQPSSALSVSSQSFTF